MRKILLALSMVFVLASFTNNTNKKTILKDIDGTLLQSYVSVEQIDGEYVATFQVDAMTVVTSYTDVTGTHINLVENGNSGVTVEYTLKVSKSLSFINYFEGSFDIASNQDMYKQSVIKEKPPTIILE